MSELIKGTIQFSIHASAKEATEFDSFLGVLQKFSIHASAKEATSIRRNYFYFVYLFNPRLREGGDY